MLFLQNAGAKVLNNYELWISNYELFCTFAPDLTSFYEVFQELRGNHAYFCRCIDTCSASRCTLYNHQRSAHHPPAAHHWWHHLACLLAEKAKSLLSVQYCLSRKQPLSDLQTGAVSCTNRGCQTVWQPLFVDEVYADTTNIAYSSSGVMSL